ncbi:alpha/beta hydrolase fold domain-containing protein [Yinghuangia aomiensis]
MRILPAEGPSGALGVSGWFHGGGYVFGDIASSDRSQDLATKAGCLVVSVEYRLPCHPWSGGVGRCPGGAGVGGGGRRGYRRRPCADRGGRRERGGRPAAALALYNWDHGGPELVLQVLDNPMLDDRVVTQSATEFTDTPLWTGQQAVLGWRFYLGETPGEVSPYAAAARAEDLVGLPAAYVAANEFDPLRDEDPTMRCG